MSLRNVVTEIVVNLKEVLLIADVNPKVTVTDSVGNWTGLVEGDYPITVIKKGYRGFILSIVIRSLLL